MAKMALVLFASPEMPCKLQHAFVFARDLAARGGEAELLFEGNLPKWLMELLNSEHKLRPMFDRVNGKGRIMGVCRGCAMMHGAVEATESFGLSLLGEASGHISLALLAGQGYEIITL